MEARRKEEEATAALVKASSARRQSSSSSSSSESETEHRKSLVRRVSATYEQSVFNGDVNQRSLNSSRSATPAPTNEDLFNREDASMKRMSLLEVMTFHLITIMPWNVDNTVFGSCHTSPC